MNRLFLPDLPRLFATQHFVTTILEQRDPARNRHFVRRIRPSGNAPRPGHSCEPPAVQSGREPRAIRRTTSGARATWLLLVCLAMCLLRPADGLAADPLDTWHARVTPTNVTLNAITYGNGRFVAVASSYAVTSVDGVSWNAHPTGNTKSLYGLAYGNNTFVAIGAGGRALTSPDGETWTLRDTDTTANFNSVSFANNQFLAAGDGGWILSSPDGVDWTPHTTPTTNYWQDITFANGQYVAVGYNYKGGAARWAVSSDLSHWEIGGTGYSRYLDCVIFVDGQFISVGYAGVVQRSTDGRVWSPAEQASTRWLFEIVRGNGVFVAVGESGAITTSPDALTWTPRMRGNQESLKSVAFGQDTFVAVGSQGTIMQSDPVLAAAPALVLTEPVRNGAGFEFGFTSVVGESYRVEYTTDLSAWSPLTTITAAGSTTAFADPAAGGSMRCYRVVKL